jgi:hypothetical protein
MQALLISQDRRHLFVTCWAEVRRFLFRSQREEVRKGYFSSGIKKGGKERFLFRRQSGEVRRDYLSGARGWRDVSSGARR